MIIALEVKEWPKLLQFILKHELNQNSWQFIQTKDNFMVALKEKKITRVMRFYPPGTMNISTSICATASCRCRDILQDKWKIGLLVALDEKSTNDQSHYNSSSGGQECLYKISWQFIQ